MGQNRRRVQRNSSVHVRTRDGRYRRVLTERNKSFPQQAPRVIRIAQARGVEPYRRRRRSGFGSRCCEGDGSPTNISAYIPTNLISITDGQAHADTSAVSSASASRSAASFGGLLSTRSTEGGRSFSASKRCPQPVSRMTGTLGAVDLTATATVRPSTLVIQRSVMTAAKGSPCSWAVRKASIPR